MVAAPVTGHRVSRPRGTGSVDDSVGGGSVHICAAPHLSLAELAEVPDSRGQHKALSCAATLSQIMCPLNTPRQLEPSEGCADRQRTTWQHTPCASHIRSMCEVTGRACPMCHAPTELPAKELENSRAHDRGALYKGNIYRHTDRHYIIGCI